MAAQWIPLMDYSMKNGVSLSTLRRYIKAGKVQYQVVDGRYLLLDDQALAENDEVKTLRAQLQRAREEIAELKTLIAFYEDEPIDFSASKSDPQELQKRPNANLAAEL